MANKGKHKIHSNQEEKFRKLAWQISRQALGNAIEWLDRKEPGWALVEAKRAVAMLEAGKAA